MTALIAIIGNYMLRRSKHSTIEVVAPKEEEEEEEDSFDTILFYLSQAIKISFINIFSKLE